jgi:hypothetical protein
MSHVNLPAAQKEILKLVSSFRGLYGPLAIEAAMTALSQRPDYEWSPIIPHLDALRAKGLIILDESAGTPRFYITEKGRHAI